MSSFPVRRRQDDSLFLFGELFTDGVNNPFTHSDFFICRRDLNEFPEGATLFIIGKIDQDAPLFSFCLRHVRQYNNVLIACQALKHMLHMYLKVPPHARGF